MNLILTSKEAATVMTPAERAKQLAIKAVRVSKNSNPWLLEAAGLRSRALCQKVQFARRSGSNATVQMKGIANEGRTGRSYFP
jgi:hypothetical protein